jgi:hypothetical protein
MSRKQIFELVREALTEVLSEFASNAKFRAEYDSNPLFALLGLSFESYVELRTAELLARGRS